MSVYIDLHLFTKPGQELSEGRPVTPQALRVLAESLHQRLHRTADTLEVLTRNGWDSEMSLYSICLSPQSLLATEADVVQELRGLGIDPDADQLFDDENEEEGASDPDDFDRLDVIA